jgi:hypothetical protein
MPSCCLKGRGKTIHGGITAITALVRRGGSQAKLVAPPSSTSGWALM